ncbi:MAG: hypothetical protein EHM28_10520, partial [Spirochaetaceae bacterium]
MKYLAGVLMLFLLLGDSLTAEKSVTQNLLVNKESNQQGIAIYLKDTIVPLTQNVRIQDITERIEGAKDCVISEEAVFNLEKNQMESMPLRSVRKALENRVTGPLILIGTRLRIMPVGMQDSFWFYKSFMDHVEKIVSNELVHIKIDFVTWPETIPVTPGTIN